jgi:soluble lytic murein transglycosylase
MPLLVHGYPVTTVPGTPAPGAGGIATGGTAAGGIAERPLILAIVRQESAFAPEAMSPVGARGLMQLMPGTARETAGKVGLPYDFGRLTSDPAYNVMLGSSYFDRLLDEWGGQAALAVASYNAGSGNVRKWVRANGDPRGGADIVTWIEAIPYSETRNYVQRVLENAVVYEAMRAQRSGGRANRLSYFLGKSGPG